MSVEKEHSSRPLDEMGPFERMLAAPSPAFVCTGARNPNAARLVRVSHRFHEPANNEDLIVLDAYADPFGADIRWFYSTSNGARLFVGQNPDSTRSATVAITLFPINMWESKRKLASSRMSGKHPRFPIESSLIVGEPPASANLFALLTEGREKGSVIYLDHEGDFRLLATSLGRFLDKIGKDPASFIYKLGCFARYNDGKSAEQWIPRVYLENVEEQLSEFNLQLRETP